MDRRAIRSQLRSFLLRLRNDTSQLGSNQEFTDGELNNFIEEASKLFCAETGILEGTEDVVVSNGVGTITGSVISVKRIEVNKKPANWIYKDAFDEDWPAIG